MSSRINFNDENVLFCLQVSATDADEDQNGKVLYFLSHEAHGAFAVDGNTGLITTSAPLDREKVASYSFQVFAVDLSPAAPRNASAQVKEAVKQIIASEKLLCFILMLISVSHVFL